jgi:DNA repair exonuclease SbcCD ATPase subunit
VNDEKDWPSNYFNYFTEIEEHFQRARGTGLFLVSPLDWALIESWKNAGVPLEAVLRGIDAAFEKWRSGKKTRTQMVNGLAYCSQAVMAEAEQMAGTAETRSKRQEVAAPFQLDELKQYLERNACTLAAARGFEEIAAGLQKLLAEADALYGDLEQLEQRLTALEDKMIAIARSRQNEESLFRARRDLDQQLKPYRGKMSAPQVAMLEKQYLERRLLEDAGLPRLSLFYLG